MQGGFLSFRVLPVEQSFDRSRKDVSEIPRGELPPQELAAAVDPGQELLVASEGEPDALRRQGFDLGPRLGGLRQTPDHLGDFRLGIQAGYNHLDLPFGLASGRVQYAAMVLRSQQRGHEVDGREGGLALFQSGDD